MEAARRQYRQKETTWAPPLQRDPGPWNRLLLRQHVGRPAVPVVRTGDRVHAGDVVAEIPEKSLGARIHAPIDGIVTRVDAKAIQVAGGESA